MDPDLLNSIQKWIPPGFENEPLNLRLMRGLLNANACVEDLRLVLKGQEPIRPLDSCPQ